MNWKKKCYSGLQPGMKVKVNESFIAHHNYDEEEFREGEILTLTNQRSSCKTMWYTEEKYIPIYENEFTSILPAYNDNHREK